MVDFVYDIRDLKFILNEWLDIYELEKFKDNYGPDDVNLILNEAYKIAKEVVFPLNNVGDKIGAKFENGSVRVPEGFDKAFKFIQDGWGSSNESLASDTRMPVTLYRAYSEILIAACPALLGIQKLTTGAANLIHRFGRDEDRALFIDKMLNGDWSGTMCITEPNAGSDAGDATTKAYPTDDPAIYKIKGTKMFITGGQTDISKNVIHMVLARPEGGASGSKGLSLYIVPKMWVNQDGSLGEPNDVICVGIEHKMGLKASPTALLNFGENDNCRGILLGKAPDSAGQSKGLSMMFHMMNESRISSGQTALAQLACAGYFAAKYAAERVQGRPFTNPKADRVPIIKHEDVKRMLLEIKAQAEAIRAMIFRGYYYLEISEDKNREDANRYKGIVEVLTPLIKTYATETAWPMIGQAIQVHGGAGFTEEFPVSQYARDSKILSIWEGTSFIQAIDLVGRKMRMKGGAPFADWMEDRQQFIEKNKNADGFQKEMGNLARAYDCVDDIRKIYDSYYSSFTEKAELIPLYAPRVLTCCAQLFAAESILDQALLAQKKIVELGKDHYDYSFYQGKVACARFYAMNILPNVYMQAEIIKNADKSALECPEEALVVG